MHAVTHAPAAPRGFGSLPSTQHLAFTPATFYEAICSAGCLFERPSTQSRRRSVLACKLRPAPCFKSTEPSVLVSVDVVLGSSSIHVLGGELVDATLTYYILVSTLLCKHAGLPLRARPCNALHAPNPGPYSRIRRHPVDRPRSPFMSSLHRHRLPLLLDYQRLRSSTIDPSNWFRPPLSTFKSVFSSAVHLGKDLVLP